MSRKRRRPPQSPEGVDLVAATPADPAAGPLVEAKLPAAEVSQGLQEIRQELTQGRVPARKETRPTYSQWDKEHLLLMVAAGVSVTTAVAAVGCSKRTFYRWLADDPSFRARFHSERARAEMDPLEMIREHAKHNWRAAQYLHSNSVRRARRERKDQQEGSDKQLVQITIAIVNLYKDLVPLVRALGDQHREAIEKVLAGHADIMEGVLQGLWRADEEAVVKRDPIWTATA